MDRCCTLSSCLHPTFEMSMFAKWPGMKWEKKLGLIFTSPAVALTSVSFASLFKIALITTMGKWVNSAKGLRQSGLLTIIWTPLKTLSLDQSLAVDSLSSITIWKSSVIFGLFKVQHNQAAYDMCQNTCTLYLQIDLCHCVKIFSVHFPMF